MRYELKRAVLPAGEWRDQNCAICGWNVDSDEDRYIAYCHECKPKSECHGPNKVYHTSCMIEWRKEFRHETGRDPGDFHNDICSHMHQLYAEDVEATRGQKIERNLYGLEPEREWLPRIRHKYK